MQAYFRALFLIGFLVALVAAAPSPRPIQKRGVFSVERRANPNFKGRNGSRQLLKSLRKYRMNIPPALLDAIRNSGSTTTTSAVVEDEFTSDREDKAKNHKTHKNHGAGTASAATTNTTVAAATNGTGIVTATPEQGDVEYLAPVTIGGQTINMDFDSGSSDLWVFSTQLDSASTAGHTVYDPEKSTTLSMIQGATWSISYGDGSGAAGNVGTDTVNIGGATVTKQAVEMATTVAASFAEDTNSNGLVGLAFSKLNTVQPQQQKTFFDNVMDSLAEPVFTADLRPGVAGAYTFGNIDSSRFNGTMAWVPVNTTEGFWQFSSTKFAVGDGEAQTGDASGQAIADTGTTLIIANPTTVTGYYSQVSGAVNDDSVGGITVPCDADLPDLMLDVGGSYMARVKGSDINYAQVSGNTCYGGVQASTSDLQIYGDIFFKSQFVAFNGGNNSLGLADHL
ncbi:hypothetical protein VPNG_02983 [Cytospora leucostoma]|uniref:Peptidase A1 domain-containing protein n=1 Tax=Cytospora leucostoma TaxID=1230097 RepID=A0A423XG53_9PEZI|nr:hypothetical protein VPNG_02983 [Cytospora leucostoma]